MCWLRAVVGHCFGLLWPQSHNQQNMVRTKATIGSLSCTQTRWVPATATLTLMAAGGCRCHLGVHGLGGRGGCPQRRGTQCLQVRRLPRLICYSGSAVWQLAFYHCPVRVSAKQLAYRQQQRVSLARQRIQQEGYASSARVRAALPQPCKQLAQPTTLPAVCDPFRHDCVLQAG
jgi:hypothetical protein